MFTGISGAFGQSGLCDTAYWNHTYTNSRLKIYDSCTTITGTIIYMITPALNGDGDYHIYVQVDTPYTWMCNYRSPAFGGLCRGGPDSIASELICAACLNVEEVCKGPVTDAGAGGDTIKAACFGFNDTVYLPNTGEHVQATGPFVYDVMHCWNELHPISKMVLYNPSRVSVPDFTSVADCLKVYPQPANNEVTFHFANAPHSVTLIKLYNQSGQLLYVYALSQTSQLNLNVSSWPSGDYLYRIVAQDQGKILRNGKFTVVH